MCKPQGSTGLSPKTWLALIIAAIICVTMGGAVAHSLALILTLMITVAAFGGAIALALILKPQARTSTGPEINARYMKTMRITPQSQLVQETRSLTVNGMQIQALGSGDDLNYILTKDQIDRLMSGERQLEAAPIRDGNPSK